MKKLITTAFLLMALANVSYGQDVERAESIIDGLTSLAEFHEQGILTDEEFSAAKRRLLGLSSTARQEEPVPTETDGNNSIETITYPSGDIYVGEFRDGQQHGQGTLTYVNGNVYVGEWRNNERSGQGILTYDNGFVYVGEFRDGQRTGQGTLKWGDKVVPLGQTNSITQNQNSKIAADQDIDTINYQNATYVGQVKNGKRHGQGTMAHANGNVYVGGWRDGERSGEGTLTWTDGTVYKGGFRKGERNGRGYYIFPNGNRESGNHVAGEWMPDTNSSAQQNSNNASSSRRSSGVDWGKVSEALQGIGRSGSLGGQGTGDSSDPNFPGLGNNINNSLIRTEGVIGGRMCHYQDGSVVRIGGGSICPRYN